MPPDDEAFAWDRLRDASDEIGPGAAKLVAYKNTAAGYAVAAVHVASLRDANMPYSVRPTDHSEYPFGIFVLPDGLNNDERRKNSFRRKQGRKLTLTLLPVRILRTLCVLWLVAPAAAQLPFYTDDPAVTPQGKWHLEFFNEFDVLQHPQYPNLRQNTANYKLNYGLPYNLELDVDAPYLSIFRDATAQSSAGAGDTNVGVKWNFHRQSNASHLPAIAASLYIEFPTGDARRQLGSGLTDYWLNFIVQKSLSGTTRLNGNIGFLFAGNTSTGVLGIQSTRGHVYTGGLSVLHSLNPRLTLGGEIFGGISDTGGLGRSQLQALVGGQYAIRNGLSLCFGLLAGKHIASPRIGGQIGFAVDFPDALRPSATRRGSYQ
jgi:Putative MetA-pathway of phenol degradation